jgi:RNA polymerase sigma-70 factor (ECF subfamily)
LNVRDPYEFSRVYDEHHRAVHAAAHRVLGDHAQAADVVQDVFLRLWRRPGAFDPARGDVGTYLRLMARSRAVDLWREGDSRGRATERLKIAVAEDPPHAGDRPDEETERSADRALVQEALRDLPPAQREALVLAYWAGLTAEQIASRERIPLGTAKSRLRLGLVKLRTALDPVAASLCCVPYHQLV